VYSLAWFCFESPSISVEGLETVQAEGLRVRASKLVSPWSFAVLGGGAWGDHHRPACPQGGDNGHLVHLVRI
jgi:hypothetical protein